MNIYSIAAICIIGALISALLKQYRPELAVLAGVGVSVFILTGVTDLLLDAISFFKEVSENSGISALGIRTLLKCIGIYFVTEFAADTCNDAGESGLASRVELFGRVASLVVSIPLLREFLNLIISLTEM